MDKLFFLIASAAWFVFTVKTAKKIFLLPQNCDITILFFFIIGFAGVELSILAISTGMIK